MRYAEIEKRLARIIGEAFLVFGLSNGNMGVFANGLLHYIGNSWDSYKSLFTHDCYFIE